MRHTRISTPGTYHLPARHRAWASRLPPSAAPRPTELWLRAGIAALLATTLPVAIQQGLAATSRFAASPSSSSSAGSLSSTLAVSSGSEEGGARLPSPSPNPRAEATHGSAMLTYTETIAGTGVSFEMVPIPAGSYLMGSPADEPGRNGDEGPTHSVTVAPFWMGRQEVTWDEYRQFMMHLDLDRERAPEPEDAFADAVTRPTPPYVPMDFGMGTNGFPAISMTQFAARHYTKWLSMRTGRFYRLPSEAEWEYACRAGLTTGPPEASELPRLGWYRHNSERHYHRGGALEPNPWGLYDMLGNVAEWVLDELAPYPVNGSSGDSDSGTAERSSDENGSGAPIRWPQSLYPRVVRGGAFTDPPERLRCAARRGSSPTWKARDPQIPQSIWYHTSARFVGLRVVRPLKPPPPETWNLYWEPDTEGVAEIFAEQQGSGR